MTDLPLLDSRILIVDDQELNVLLLRIQNLLKTRQLYLQLQSQNQILEQKVAERTAELARSIPLIGVVLQTHH